MTTNENGNGNQNNRNQLVTTKETTVMSNNNDLAYIDIFIRRNTLSFVLTNA